MTLPGVTGSNSQKVGSGHQVGALGRFSWRTEILGSESENGKAD